MVLAVCLAVSVIAADVFSGVLVDLMRISVVSVVSVVFGYTMGVLETIVVFSGVDVASSGCSVAFDKICVVLWPDVVLSP